MNTSLNQKYLDVEFSDQLINMFADIIEHEVPIKRLLLHIGKHADSHKNDELGAGISIKILCETIIIERRVRSRKGKFSYESTNIDRKQCERLVETLLKMSLCYYVSVPPSKLIYLTKRGRQVARELVRRSSDRNKV